MIQHGVAAFVILPAYANGTIVFEGIERTTIPTMQVLRLVDDRTDLFPFAVPDYAVGGRLAARHLRELGGRNIAFVGGFEHRLVTIERMSGYLDVVAEDGLRP